MKCMKYMIATLVLGVCVVGTVKFIFGDRLEQKADIVKTIQKTEKETSMQKQEMKNTKEKSYWDLVRDSFLKIDYSYLENEEKAQIQIHESNEEVSDINWIYNIEGAVITKKCSKEWKGMRDYGDFICDENGTILNAYSYVAIPIRITANDGIERDELLGLTNIILCAYDKNADEVYRDEIAAANVNGPKTSKNLFLCSLSEGEQLKTELVYIVPDKYLTKDGGYFLKMNCTGGTVNEHGEVCLIKVPMGVENEKND